MSGESRAGGCGHGRGRWIFLMVMVAGSMFRTALGQTPSPMQEWQYSSGIPLVKLFQPEIPTWNVVLGAGAQVKPLYDGAQNYRTQFGPVVNIRYRDIAFFSFGEGLGVNILRGEHYSAGLALTYDLGRNVSDDENHLKGLPDIKRAPVVKAFATYVVSKEFPLVVRTDVRQSVARGRDGLVGDVDAYLPLPGSSRRLVMFAGPSVTIASRDYLEKRFGITGSESQSSGYTVYDPHAGTNAIGVGFSATGFVTEHWLVNLNSMINWLQKDARDSPLTQRTSQPGLALSMGYLW